MNYRLVHQSLVLRISVRQGRLAGFTELHVAPEDGAHALHVIRAHTRQVAVTKVAVNGAAAEYVHSSKLGELFPAGEAAAPDMGAGGGSAERVQASLDALRNRFAEAFKDGEEGEMSIVVPDHADRRRLKDGSLGYIVKINFNLASAAGGLYFAKRGDCPFVYSVPGHNRLWFPCVDSDAAVCTWELELTVESGMIMVSTGELQEQVYDDDETHTTFFYHVPTAVSARTIAIAAGPFKVYPDEKLSPFVTHFCLPDDYDNLVYTVGFLHQVFDAFKEYLSCPFPFESYKQVFLPQIYAVSLVGSSTNIFRSDLLHDEHIIDQAIKTRCTIARAVAQQYFGCNTTVATRADRWLLHGLAGHLTSVYERRAFGMSQFKFNLCEEFDDVCNMDVRREPLFRAWYSRSQELESDEVVRRKAPLVMYMLEKRVGEDHFVQVVRTLLDEAKGSGPTNTKAFLDLLGSVAKYDTKVFANQWIYGHGCPFFTCGFIYSSRRGKLEFVIKQDTHGRTSHFTGKMTVRIFESDGTYDHVVDIEEAEHCFEFPVYSKTRRSYGGYRRPYEDITALDQLKAKNDTPLLWIRVDPEQEWLQQLVFKQPDYMWASQIERDPDVVGQFYGISGIMASNPTAGLVACERLLNSSNFYRIRMMAANALSNCPGIDLQGPRVLRSFLLRRYIDPATGLLVPNNFEDIAEYHVKKAVVRGLALTQDMSGKTPPEAIQMVANVLQSTNNQGNVFSDNYFIEAILSAAGRIRGTPEDAEAILKQVRRFLNLDTLEPSYQGTVTAGCIEALGALGGPTDLPTILEYARTGSSMHVRLAAVRTLARHASRDAQLRHDLLDLLRDRKDPLRQIGILSSLIRLPPFHMTPDINLDTDECIRDRTTLWALVNTDSAFDIRLRAAALLLFTRQSVLGIAEPGTPAAERDPNAKKVTILLKKKPAPPPAAAARPPAPAVGDKRPVAAVAPVPAPVVAPPAAAPPAAAPPAAAPPAAAPPAAAPPAAAPPAAAPVVAAPAAVEAAPPVAEPSVERPQKIAKVEPAADQAPAPMEVDAGAGAPAEPVAPPRIKIKLKMPAPVE